jgi:uncharacterized membrane protein YcjF (UPF0283 family)
MTHRKDGFILNDPSRRSTERALKGEVPEESPTEMPTRQSGHREGEVIIAVPEPENIKTQTLSESELQQYQQIDEKAEQKRLDALASQLLKKSGGMTIPAGLRKACMWSLSGIAAVLMLLMVGQVTSSLAQLRTLPIWSQWVVGTLLGLIVLVILCIVMKIIMLFLKLRRNEQVNLEGISVLSEREALRQLVSLQSAEAVKKLKLYIDDFPVDEKDKFLELGFNQEEFSEFKKARLKLIASAEHEDAKRWLALYKSGFQEVLDQIATRRAKAYATKTALKTAISPLALLDNVIVLALSLAMVRDMMALYNLRMNVAGASQILLRAIGQAYIAGEMQDFSEVLAESLGDMIGEQTGQLTARVGKIVGSKAGEGMANGLMIYRLGRATSKLLQASC